MGGAVGRRQFGTQRSRHVVPTIAPSHAEEDADVIARINPADPDIVWATAVGQSSIIGCRAYQRIGTLRLISWPARRDKHPLDAVERT